MHLHLSLPLPAGTTGCRSSAKLTPQTLSRPPPPPRGGGSRPRRERASLRAGDPGEQTRGGGRRPLKGGRGAGGVAGRGRSPGSPRLSFCGAPRPPGEPWRMTRRAAFPRLTAAERSPRTAGAWVPLPSFASRDSFPLSRGVDSLRACAKSTHYFLHAFPRNKQRPPQHLCKKRATHTNRDNLATTTTMIVVNTRVVVASSSFVRST